MQFYRSTKGLNLAFDSKNQSWVWAKMHELNIAFRKDLLQIHFPSAKLCFGRKGFLTGHLSMEYSFSFIFLLLFLLTSPFPSLSLASPFKGEQDDWLIRIHFSPPPF